MNQVKALGGASSSARTAEQAQIARFWSDFSYTATPAGHWQEIAVAIARSRTNSLAENARLFALLSLAQADAGIVTWEAKYRYNLWRPVTAIQRADEDGNMATDADPAWTSFLNTPPFPEYTSGHSTFSAASASVIRGFFGTDDISFTIGSDTLPGVFRSFTSLSACADEVGMSRIYGGIHFMSANRDGKQTGAAIGSFIVRNFLLPNDALPRLDWERSADELTRLRIHGHVGRSCAVEVSGDLVTWTPLSTNAAVVGGFTLTPSRNDASARFFRVREE